MRYKNNFTSQKNPLVYFAKHGINEEDVVRLSNRAKHCATFKLKGKVYTVWIKVIESGGFK